VGSSNSGCLEEKEAEEFQRVAGAKMTDNRINKDNENYEDLKMRYCGLW
jgi:hypothetical protein